jgi:hypothetical protein
MEDLKDGGDDPIDAAQILPSNPVLHTEGKVARPLDMGNPHVDSIGQGQQNGDTPNQTNHSHAHLNRGEWHFEWEGMPLALALMPVWTCAFGRHSDGVGPGKSPVNLGGKVLIGEFFCQIKLTQYRSSAIAVREREEMKMEAPWKRGSE